MSPVIRQLTWIYMGMWKLKLMAIIFGLIIHPMKEA